MGDVFHRVINAKTVTVDLHQQIECQLKLRMKDPWSSGMIRPVFA